MCWGFVVEDFGIELVLEAEAECGECPVWDARRQKLLWVDIPRGLVHIYDPVTGSDRVFDLGQPVGSLARRAGGGMIVALAEGFGFFDEESGELDIIAPVETAGQNGLMNDGKCDARGRFWAGTATEPPEERVSALYQLDTDLSVEKVLEGVTLSNGMGWSLDRALMYYIDSTTGGVDVFDYDPDSGRLGNRRRPVPIAPELGMPDGMTVDAEGHLWVAIYGGSAVHRYSPRGELEAVVHLPVTQVTSCAFGGESLEDLYVTTARENFSEAQARQEPQAGGLFRCRPGIRGVLPAEFQG
jgi:sugar lactone lactonase YvrE